MPGEEQRGCQKRKWKVEGGRWNENRDLRALTAEKVMIIGVRNLDGRTILLQ
jgi:hypothetical protein